MSVAIRVNTREHPDDVPICEGCKQLPEQKEGKHWCRKYGRKLKHLGLHPHLPRLPECIRDNGYE